MLVDDNNDVEDEDVDDDGRDVRFFWIFSVFSVLKNFMISLPIPLIPSIGDKRV